MAVRSHSVALFIRQIFLLFVITATSFDGASMCPDFQETADLCLDGSGSDEGPGDLRVEANDVRAICRLDRLMTWFSPSEEHQTMAYRMIQSCTKVKDRTSSDAECEKVDLNDIVTELVSLLPVTSVTSNMTYYNSYCFWCSSDPGPGLIWSLNISCSQWLALQSSKSEQDLIVTAMKSPFCWIRLQPPPGVFPETCMKRGLTSTQPSTASDTRIQSDNSTQNDTQDEGAATSTLSILLNFRDKGAYEATGQASGGGQRAEGHVYQKSPVCSNDEFHETITNRCMRLKCTFGKRLRNQRCQPFVQRAKGLAYQVTLSIDVFVTRPNDAHRYLNLTLTSQSTLEEVVDVTLRDRLSLLHSEAYVFTGLVVEDFGGYAPSASDVLIDNDENVVLHAREDKIEKQAASITRSSARLSSQVEVDKNNTSFWGRVELRVNFIVTSETEIEDLELAALAMTQNDLYVKWNESYLRISPKISKKRADSAHSATSTAFVESRSFRTVVKHPDYVTLLDLQDVVDTVVSPFLFCPYLTFSTGDFQINATAQGTAQVTLLNLSVSLMEEGVEVDGSGKLRICRDTFEEILAASISDRSYVTHFVKDRRTSLVQNLQSYISLVCVSVSLLALFITFTILTLRPDLRSLQGHTAMALCASLFLAQSLLQFGARRTEHPGTCVALGMAVHYFWLATALWTTICSFHLHHVVAEHFRGSTRKDCCSRRFLGYSLFAQGIPAVVVSGTAAASILLSDGRQVGYGGATCFLSTSASGAITLALPIGFVILFNLALFVCTAHCEANSASPEGANHPRILGERKKQKQKTVPWRPSMNLCLWLSLLTGLTWILELLAQGLDSQGLYLLSSMVNGSQGVLVALSYLVTRQMARLYSQAFCSRWQSFITRSILRTPSETGGTACTVSSADGPCYIVCTPYLMQRHDEQGLI